MGGPNKKQVLLDIRQLGVRTGISTSTLWRLKRAGKIPFYQPGGKGSVVRFPEDAIEQALQSGRTDREPAESDESTDRLAGPMPSWMNQTKLH